MVLIGLYGALAAAKYHERANYHLSQARALTRALVQSGQLPDNDALLDQFRRDHYHEYPRLHRIRLHWLWTGLHLGVAAYGLVLVILTLVGERMNQARADQDSGGPLAVVLGLLAADAPGRVMGAPEDWPRWAVLLPHVLAATGHFTPRPGPEDQRAGRMRRGCWIAPRPTCRCMPGWPRPGRWPSGPWPSTRPPTAPTTPPSPPRLNNLALIWQDLGEPGKARPLAERALAITEAAYGPDHPDVGTRLNNLALIWQDLGAAGEGPAAGRTGPGHRRGRLRPRPPHRRHPAEQPRPHLAGPG